MDEKNETKEIVAETRDFNFSAEEINDVRWALSGISQISSELMDKVGNDSVVKEFGIASFFPIVGERIINGETPIIEAINANTRGRGFKAIFNDGAFITKPIENNNEPKIALLMSEMGIGPKQYESLENYITEEFVEGAAIKDLKPEQCSPEFMQGLGVKITEAVERIHSKGILINDQLLSDDFGKSHTIVGSDGGIRFIDFGASVDLNEFPNISDDAVYAIMRSDGMASMMLGMATQDNIGDIINDYRKKFISEFKTKEDVMACYDGQLMSEGLSFLSQRIGGPAVKAMVSGMQSQRSN